LAAAGRGRRLRRHGDAGEADRHPQKAPSHSNLHGHLQELPSAIPQRRATQSRSHKPVTCGAGPDAAASISAKPLFCEGCVAKRVHTSRIATHPPRQGRTWPRSARRPRNGDAGRRPFVYDPA
jgi:hypothetical protein